MYESDDKMVSHPDHYQSNSGLEVIDVIEAFTEDLSGIEAADTANIIKYACRWKRKNGIQDLKKIMWYTQHLIDHMVAKEAHHEKQEDYPMIFCCRYCGDIVEISGIDYEKLDSSDHGTVFDLHANSHGIFRTQNSDIYQFIHDNFEERMTK